MRVLGVFSLVLVGALVAVFHHYRPPHIELQAGGELLVNGKRTSLAALSRAHARGGAATLHVADGVPWAQVEWVLAALRAGGAADAWIDLPGGAVNVRFDSDFWLQDVRHVPRGHWGAVVTVGAEDLARADLAGWIEAEAARIDREHGIRPLGHIFPEPTSPFGTVAPALSGFRNARVGLEAPVCWVWWEALPDSEPLPTPSETSQLTLWLRWMCACRPGILSADLPVADMCEEDHGQEEDDRLFLHLDREGRLAAERRGALETMSLDGLATFLREAEEKYDLKMRQQGKSGFEMGREKDLSRLYVLIRADRAAPAQHVGWILHVLAEQGFYKVQFAARRSASEDRGPCRGALAGKLQVFLPTDNVPDIVSSEEPMAHVYVGPDSYGIDGARGLDVEGLPGPLTDSYRRVREEPDRKAVVAVHVGRDVAWERVITVVNLCNRVGLEVVDLHDLAPPDEATRRAKPLPR